MISMVVGEVSNFSAYAFAPAILVTPLGALSIIVRCVSITMRTIYHTRRHMTPISAILAHIMLNEKLNVFGMLGCLLCIVGSVTIVLHSPEERVLHSVKEVWHLAAQPAFMLYAILAVALIAFLIFHVSSEHGASVIFVFIGICSLAGSLSVMSCKVRGSCGWQRHICTWPARGT